MAIEGQEIAREYQVTLTKMEQVIFKFSFCETKFSILSLRMHHPNSLTMIVIRRSTEPT